MLGGKTVVKFQTLLVTCGAFNGDYKLFRNKDLVIMQDFNWKIIAINLKNIVCKRSREKIYNREEIKTKVEIWNISKCRWRQQNGSNQDHRHSPGDKSNTHFEVFGWPNWHITLSTSGWIQSSPLRRNSCCLLEYMASSVLTQTHSNYVNLFFLFLFLSLSWTVHS